MAPTAVLWDIDGTLLRAGGAGARAFVDALLTVTGLPFPTADMDMGGRTDPDIARRILQFAEAPGDHDELADRMLTEVAAIYLTRQTEFAAKTSVIEGVPEALAALDGYGAVQTVVTGNIEPIARMKVAAAQVADRLQLELGGYGSDHRLRAELVHVAGRRIAAAIEPIDPARTWIIGDTPRDLECARVAGVKCVLVATGYNSVAKLAPLGADAVFADLTDLDRFLTLVTG